MVENVSPKFKIYIWTRGQGIPSGTVAEFDYLSEAEFAVDQLNHFGASVESAGVRAVRLYNKK